MSWFGFGGQAPAKKDETLKSTDDLMNQPTFPVSSPGSATSNFEKELMAEQEKILVQTVIFNLTQISFEKCVSKPSSQLSAAERNCIAAVSTKYLETTQFIVNSIGPSLLNQQQQ